MRSTARRFPAGRVKPLSQARASGLTLRGLGLVLSLFFQSEVLAEEFDFDIPAQPLSGALKQLARQGDLQVLYNPDDVRDKTGSPVRGRLTPQQAVAALLKEAGVAHTLEDNTLTLGQTPVVQAIALRPVAIQGKSFGVGSEENRSYTANTVSLNKTAHSLRETPQSVTVVTRQLMDDKNLTGLDDVMAQTPGITFSQRNFGSHVFSSRGFTLEDESYTLDGVSGQGYSVTGWMTPDMEIYDRVEVLRGAAGLLIGAGNPGGAVNLVRKRPTALPRLSVTTRAGSWDNYRVDLDGSSRLNESGTLRGRFVASYEDRGYFIDLLHKTAPLLYGIVESDLSDDTTLTLGLRHQRADIRGYSIFGLPRYSDGRALDLSRATSLAQDWNRHQTQTDEVFGELQHRFDDDWSGTLSVTHSQGTFDQQVAYAQGAIDPTTLTGSRVVKTLFRDDELTSNGFDSHLDGRFEAFGLSHQLTLGANGSEQQRDSRYATVGTRLSLDVFDPDHDLLAEPARPAWNRTDFSDQRYGVYSNLRLSLSESLSLVMGGRVSWYDYQARSADVTTRARQDHQLTPFVGVIYDLDADWSWYASYTDIFLPQSSYRTASGSVLDPAIGASHETGIKGELFDKRLNLSLALFYVRQKDVAVEDDAHVGQCLENDTYGTCYLNGEIRRSKGIELEASGELLPGLQTLAGYTFNVTRDNDGQSISAETPRHLFRMTTTYTLPGAWKRLSVGGGVSAQTGYATHQSTQPIANPGRAIWDARAAWKVDEHWTVALNANNLFDRKYYKATGDIDRGNYYGDPRNCMLTLRGEF